MKPDSYFTSMIDTMDGDQLLDLIDYAWKQVTKGIPPLYVFDAGPRICSDNDSRIRIASSQRESKHYITYTNPAGVVIKHKNISRAMAAALRTMPDDVLVAFVVNHLLR